MPKVVFSSIIPFPGYIAVNLFGIIVIRKEFKHWFEPGASEWQQKRAAECLNHESIHTAQMKEMLFIFFYIFYLIEWLIRLILPPWKSSAYNSISFEQEAYEHQEDFFYLKNRKHFAWVKYLFRSKK